MKTFLLVLSIWTCLCNAQSIVWEQCPPDQITYEGYTSMFMKDCAFIPFPLNRNNPADGNINIFVRRFYATNPTAEGIWYNNGGPGFSLVATAPIADFLVSANSNWTVYLQDHRGTGLSSPVNCPDGNPPALDPYNSTTTHAYSKCMDSIAVEFGSKLQYYTPDAAAADLGDTIKLTNLNHVSIVSLSYGTYMTNVLLKREDVKIDTVILDGPVAPGRWYTGDGIFRNRLAAENLLRTCAETSARCKSLFGSMGHLPMLVMNAIIDKTLGCLDKLPWLASAQAQFQLTLWVSNMAAIKEHQPLLGPLFSRLYRCSESDVAQLNVFREWQQGISSYIAPTIDDSLALGLNIGGSELYAANKETELNYDQQVQQVGRSFASGGGEIAMSYVRYETKWKPYEFNATNRKIARPSMPVYVLVGTLDPNTENGLGTWFRDGLGPYAQLIEVPYEVHGTFNYYNACVQGIVLQILATRGAGPIDQSCLALLPPPDFDGVEEATQQMSMTAFGVKDLWNGAK